MNKGDFLRYDVPTRCTGPYYTTVLEEKDDGLESDDAEIDVKQEQPSVSSFQPDFGKTHTNGLLIGEINNMLKRCPHIGWEGGFCVANYCCGWKSCVVSCPCGLEVVLVVLEHW